MELSEALSFLEENKLAVATTIGASGKSQATVVSAGLYEGKMAFVSRGQTVKVKNAARNGRCAVTVIKPDTTRYVTVEGPATVHGWDNTGPDELLDLLQKVYTALGRRIDNLDAFHQTMREEQRTIVLVTLERFYGSLVRSAR